MEELKKRLIDISHINSALTLLDWDQNVYMPEKGSEKRAQTISHLRGLLHNAFTSIDHDKLLSNLKAQADQNKITGSDAVIVYETWRVYEREKKLPIEFVKEMTEITSAAHSIWAKAREKNNFKSFQPTLENIITLKRKEAEYVGYKESPYDALLDQFEPGLTSKVAVEILTDLKNFLVPFLKEITTSRIKINSKKILGNFPIPLQEKFNKEVVEKLGFDFTAGRLDITTHPFATSMHPDDVRITTRYSEKDFFYSLFGSIHEMGHGLYDQGLPQEHFGTPLAESISLGIHESQSRLWENLIGRSKSFWKFLHPRLAKAFPRPFAKIKLDELYVIINKVEPSFIRVLADEVTYNLHIILRFELEKDLIEGKIQVKDLPQLWKKKMKEYLGVTVPNDALGVLQDVHWSAGLIGYFPTYTLGNLYSAQFFDRMKNDIKDLEQKISVGDFSLIKKWLNKNIHAHGKLYTAEALVKKVTGENLSSGAYVNYLKEKYEAIYSKGRSKK